MNRRWITRDEIAEIHEAIAKKARKEAAPKFWEGENPLDYLRHAYEHERAAETLRYADQMDRIRVA